MEETTRRKQSWGQNRSLIGLTWWPEEDEGGGGEEEEEEEEEEEDKDGEEEEEEDGGGEEERIPIILGVDLILQMYFIRRLQLNVMRVAS